MSLAHYDLLSPTLARPAIHGEAACLQACDRLAGLDAATWLTLPVCGGGTARDFTDVLRTALGAGAATFPYAAIAAEAERALERGIRSATPVALLLLAALALGSGAAADGPRALARHAVEMAARLGPRSSCQACILHAALVAPFTGAFEQAARELADLCEGEARFSCAQLYLAGNGFMAGLPLPDLARQAAQAAGLPQADAHAGAAAAELAVRARLLAGLMERRDAPILDRAPVPQDQGFGLWVTHLQAAVYDGDHALARTAAAQAEALAGPLLPAGDRMSYHLFAALAWSQSHDSEAMGRIDRHCNALRRLAQGLPAGALVGFAEAARAGHRGDALGALQGFDGAGAEAARQGRHAIAALAWEQAARQAQACRLGGAVQHYRREALACWDQWGAAGRAAMLRRTWDMETERPTERERALQAGRVGELGLSIAHEVNQPLAAISLHAAAARKWLHRSEPDIERALSSLSLISAAGQHAGDIVRSVQCLASRKAHEMGSVPMDATIIDTLRLLRRPLRRHGIEVELALGLGDCAIHASRVQLQQVLTNLLVNATEALAGSGADAPARRIRIQSRRCGPQEIEIAVSDNGPGIAPEHAGRVFGSLFSTKPNSTGMGLSISLAIVRAHRGHIDYEPCRPHGACFRFRLPVECSHP